MQKRAFHGRKRSVIPKKKKHLILRVGLVVTSTAPASRAVLKNGIKALKEIWHRGC